MNEDLELIASVVHGVQAFGYIEGAVYHWRKHNWWELALCAIMIPYHTKAVFKHLEKSHEERR